MDERERQRLLATNAEAYARVALANIQREFPASAPYYITGPGPLPGLRELHPSFYGSLDWHSCVEMHWVLVRLLRLFPSLDVGREARVLLETSFSAENLATETAYLEAHRGFERPYGWGWALRLASELDGWDEPDATRWARSFAPLAAVLDNGFRSWLPKATYPQRTGLHGNSAFGLSLALAHARASARAGQPELESVIASTARRWYTRDADYPARFEPGGSDFLSPALTEAALMAELYGRAEFTQWFDRFLPQIPASLLEPAIVNDPSDGQIAHLHGLNLSRAYCMRLICEALPPGDARLAVLDRAMTVHADASLRFAVGSDYMVEHWLAAYALLLLS